MKYEYKKVDGWSFGSIIDSMDSGEVFYCKNYELDEWEMIEYHTFNLDEIRDLLSDGEIYTRTERPWWVGCEGSIIAVRNSEQDEWRYDVFERYNENINFLDFECNYNNWALARPLTSAERDAIKVSG